MAASYRTGGGPVTKGDRSALIMVGLGAAALVVLLLWMKKKGVPLASPQVSTGAGGEVPTFKPGVV